MADRDTLDRFLANARDGVRQGYIASWSLTHTREGFMVTVDLADRTITIVSPDLERVIERVSERMVDVVLEPERGAVLQ